MAEPAVVRIEVVLDDDDDIHGMPALSAALCSSDEELTQSAVPATDAPPPSKWIVDTGSGNHLISSPSLIRA